MFRKGSELAKRKARGREINGVLVIDKPLGESSNKVLQIVKTAFQAQKAGHTGSLDPLATGVLPICLGEATKFSRYLLSADKAYVATAKLGQTTNTGDAEGEIRDRRTVNVSDEQLDKVLASFVGVQQQIPSMFSALKHNGQPLYKLARQGIEIDRPSREIDIKSLKLLSFGDEEITIAVECSKGTYIRSLVEDIGEALGCGAYVSALRRTEAGPYKSMVTMRELFFEKEQGGLAQIDAKLLPLESILSGTPEVVLDDRQTYFLKQGQQVALNEQKMDQSIDDQSMLTIFEEDADGRKQFIGVGEFRLGGFVQAKRLLKTN